ncbi:thermonuclease family protein [Cytobacillus depressus]|uniref:thermonuclease family protein n=1 Tax=Cytobacillus depressus TaxID=1602942 RepID=UPI001FEC223C|nr:thermonuclease family protein [Cytobacillus depressus]
MYKVKQNLILFAAIILLFSFPVKSEAHPGGKDELGGHFRKADCVYLLHDPTELAKKASNMTELIQLIKTINSNSTCTSGLNEGKVDLEGYSFSSQNTNAGQIEAGKQTTTVNATQSTSNELKLGEKYSAELVKCVDGDTAHFNINGQVYKTRFLYIDTPESTNKVEPFGKEASAFACNFLKSDKITLETDGPSLFDKYDRLLAWIWVGDQLFQEEITKVGFVKKFYDYGDYLYEDRIISAMADAKKLSKGMYAPQEEVSADEKNIKQPINTEDLEKEVNTLPIEEKVSDNKKDESSGQNEAPESKSSSGNAIIGILAIISLIYFFRKKKKRS